MDYKVFISYRRSDSEGIAGRLYDRLISVLPSEQVFIDVGSITKGADFIAVMTERVTKSDVVLALIGPGWLGAADNAGNRRLEDAQDPVRLELEKALKHGKIVIPVLIGRTEMPAAKQLPKALKQLARRNAERLTHENFMGDSERLVQSMKLAIAERQVPASTVSVDSNHKERTAGRSAITHVDPSDLELLEWETVSSTDDPEQILNHLDRWPGGQTADSAYYRLEELDWIRISSLPDANALSWFLSAYPYGRYSAAAGDLLARMESAVKAHQAGHNTGRSSRAELLSELRPADQPAAPRPREPTLSRRLFLPLGAVTTAGIGFLAWRFGGIARGLSPKPKITLTSQKRFYAARFSPDGRRILTGAHEDLARIWDSSTGAALGSVPGHLPPIVSVNYSPDGSSMGTTSSDHSAKIWRTQDNGLAISLKGHKNFVNYVEFSPDSRRIATSSDDGTVKIWDAAKGNLEASFDNVGVSVLCARYSTDGARLAAALVDGTVAIWNTLSGTREYLLQGHQDYVRTASFSHDGSRIVTASDDKTVKIWRTSDGQEESVLLGHSESVNSAEFSPDDRYIVTASSDSSVRLWHAKRMSEVVKLNNHAGVTVAASFSPDGSRLVTASYDGTAIVWELL